MYMVPQPLQNQHPFWLCRRIKFSAVCCSKFQKSLKRKLSLGFLLQQVSKQCFKSTRNCSSYQTIAPFETKNSVVVWSNTSTSVHFYYNNPFSDVSAHSALDHKSRPGFFLLLKSAGDINSQLKAIVWGKLSEPEACQRSWFTNQTSNYVRTTQIPIWVCWTTSRVLQGNFNFSRIQYARVRCLGVLMIRGSSREEPERQNAIECVDIFVRVFFCVWETETVMTHCSSLRHALYFFNEVLNKHLNCAALQISRMFISLLWPLDE